MIVPEFTSGLFRYNSFSRLSSMNLFATHEDPLEAAYSLPDKLIVKMPLENAQMLAANFSEEFLGYGGLSKKDGGFYKTTHKNHPCTIWGRETKENTAWMIMHGLGLCAEFHRRYGKVHAALRAHLDAKRLFEAAGGQLTSWPSHTPFVRAMSAIHYPFIRHNSAIETVEAYQQYLHHKYYAKWKAGDRVPEWWDAELFERIHA